MRTLKAREKFFDQPALLERKTMTIEEMEVSQARIQVDIALDEFTLNPDEDSKEALATSLADFFLAVHQASE